VFEDALGRRRAILPLRAATALLCKAGDGDCKGKRERGRAERQEGNFAGWFHGDTSTGH
jgi:hypothetical protein